MHALNIQNGKASIAYVGQTPWHGLGQRLTENSDLDTWMVEAGMTYEILSSPLTYRADNRLITSQKKVALYRSDTGEELGVVGPRYQIVQPEEIISFFRDLCEERGFQMETAGVLFNGSRYWALANTPNDLRIKGDHIKQYLLLATACDGSMATTAKYVYTRVVCYNTIQAALKESVGGGLVKVHHNSKFKTQAVKKELQIADEGWEKFIGGVKQLAATKIDNETAASYLIETLGGDSEKSLEDQTVTTINELYERFVTGAFLGSSQPAAKGTLWGLLNVVTENVDWHRGNIPDRRLMSAWLGKGAVLKQEAFEKALELVR